MAAEFSSLNKIDRGSEVRFTSDYLYTQYGENANKKELAHIKGIVIALKRMGLSSETYASVAWDNGLTYQVPVEYLESVYADKKKVPA